MADRVRFEVATAQTFTGTGYDLITTFDALHDMGDPVGAARRVRQALAPDRTWLLVEPYASDVVAENFNPVGRLARRQARRRSATWSAEPGSAGSGGPRRARSTSCSRSDRSRPPRRV